MKTITHDSLPIYGIELKPYGRTGSLVETEVIVGRDLSDGGWYRTYKQPDGTYTLRVHHCNGDLFGSTGFKSRAAAAKVASLHIRRKWKKMYPVLHRPPRSTD